MKIVTTSSALGFVVGFIAFPLLLWGGLYLYFHFAFSGADAARGGGLEPPELPVETSVNLDWTVQSLDGAEVNLGDYARGKTLFLNFWATWCSPCVAELPSIEKLYSQFGGEVAFVCVAQEQADMLKKFLAGKNYSFPVFVAGTNPPEALNTTAIPATFIISPEGRILLKHMGGADWAHESVVAFLKGKLGRG